MTGPKPGIVHFTDDGCSSRYHHVDVNDRGWVVARKEDSPLWFFPPHRIAEIKRLE